MSMADAVPMRPMEGDSHVEIPMTFDYRGGRSQQFRGRLLAAGGTLVITLFITFLILRSGNGFFFGLIWSAVVMSAGILATRFLILQERSYRKTYDANQATNYELDPAAFWGIFEVEDAYPHLVSFKNNKRGIFIQLDRDAIVGKEAFDEHKHFEAIGDALRSLLNTDVRVGIIDVMESIGNDPRLAQSMAEVARCENPDVKQALTDIFLNLGEEMQYEYSTQEVYVLAYRGKDETFMDIVMSFLATIMEGNYKDFQFLDRDGIRQLVSSVYNLHDFSVNEATSRVFSSATSETQGVIPLSITHADSSVTVLSKSSAENAEDAKRRAELAAFQASEGKKNSRRNRRKGNDDTPEEDLDIL